MGFGGAPPLYGIEGLNVETYADFRLGRITEDNLSEMKLQALLLGNNVVILSDKMPTKRPGYTLVQKIASGPVIRTFDYQRTVDNAQYLVSQANGQLLASRVDGTGGSPVVLSSGEDLEDTYDFVAASPYALYMSNAHRSWVLLDNSGTPTLYPWGITAPAAAPTVVLSAGTVTTTYGWQWAYCYVRKVTDGQGNTRIHVGPPSPLSDSSGPLTSQLATLSGFTPPPNASWNYIWIFRTNDVPEDSTSALFFDAEIPVAQTSYADSNLDSTLDLTRPIPYDNTPPPLGSIIVMYQSRVVVAGTPGSPDLVSVGGFEEILLGMPAECFPADLIFQVPGGLRAVSAMVPTQNALYISTKDFWFKITGYNAATFNKSDNVCQPGAVGKKAATLTPTHLVYMGKDRKLYGWDMSSARPINLSISLGKPLLGTKSMADISKSYVENTEVRYLSDGRFAHIVVLANTGAVGPLQFDWIQLWYAGFLGQLLPPDYEEAVGLCETDFWPSDIVTASNLVEVGNQTYLFLGDPNGNVYRWPDGYQDNGKNFGAALGSIWSVGHVFIGPMFHPIPPQEVVKKFMFFDLHTDRQDCQQSFQLEAVVGDSPDMTLWPVNVPLGPLMGSGRQGPVLNAARGHLHLVPKCSTGRWARFLIVFPDDGNPATVIRFGISARPLYGVAP